MRTMLNPRRRHYLARISTFLIVIALIAGMVGCVPVGCVPTEQEEEEEEEQYIEDWNELNAIRNKLSGTYFLANNLDKDTDGYNELASPTANGGRGWEPVGTEDQPFTGSFYGEGHTISGLYVSRPDEDDIGLFGYVKEGLVKNVGLVEVDVTGRNQTGALVGYNWGGTVESDPTQPYSTYSTGSVTGDDKVGGLVGYNWGGTVSLSQSSAHIAHVSGEAWRAGGLVGSNWGDVLLCMYSGSVTGDREVGGLVGLNGNIMLGGLGGRVISCYGEYTVTGNWFVGGAAGVNLGSLDNIALNFSVNGRPLNTGSFVALNTDATINGHSSDTAPQGSYVGGLAGLNKGSVDKCVTVGSVSGDTYAGGLVGYNEGTISASFAAATVEGTEYSDALVGYEDPAGTVTDSASGTATNMMDLATFLEAGWDICSVAAGEVNTACTWNIAPGGYPFLSGKELEQYTLIILSTEGGEVTSPGEGAFTYYGGSVVDLAAEADEGYSFVNWTGDVGTIADVNDPTTTITTDADYSITANFAVIPPAEYDLTISSTTGGSVTIPGEGTFTYDEGTVVNLLAQAEQGGRFVTWTGDVGTIADVNDATTTITMNGDYTITANFVITISITARVETVDDPDNILGEAISVGDIITGTYTYNPATTDSNASPTVGDYWHTSSPCGITVNAGSFVFQTDPSNVEFLVEIVNDHGTPAMDNYLLRSYNNLPLYTGALVEHISWQLDDPTHTSLSSDDLPTTPPVLTDWESVFGLTLRGGNPTDPYGSSYLIRAHVTTTELRT